MDRETCRWIPVVPKYYFEALADAEETYQDALNTDDEHYQKVARIALETTIHHPHYLFQCSYCGGNDPTGHGGTPYCPWCGAEMEDLDDSEIF